MFHGTRDCEQFPFDRVYFIIEAHNYCEISGALSITQFRMGFPVPTTPHYTAISSARVIQCLLLKGKRRVREGRGRSTRKELTL